MLTRTLAVLLLVAGLSAQNVTGSVVALTPIVAQTTVGGQTWSQTVPIGGPASDLRIVRTDLGGGDTAMVALNHQTLVTRSVVDVRLSAVASAGGQGLTSIGPYEVVLLLLATVPTNVELRLDGTQTATGAQQIVGEVDVGNDGTIDLAGGLGQFGQMQSLLLGPSGLVVRMRLGATASQGLATSMLHLLVRTAATVTTTQIQPSCGPQNRLGVSANLENELVFYPEVSLPANVGFNVLVLGYQQSPVTLPFGNCVLVPSLDFVRPFPSSCNVDMLPVPLRPLTFFAQTVHLDALAGTATTSDARQVTLQ